MIGGGEIRMWTSLAPPWRSILTIFRLVGPRAMESSTTTTPFPPPVYPGPPLLFPQRPDALLRLNEGPAHVVVADQALLERDVRAFRIPQRGRHARVGYRDDDVGRHVGFLGELTTQRLARRVDVVPVDLAVRAGKVDVLEDAHRPPDPPGRMGRVEGPAVHQDQFAR